ncbi:MAG: ABC transporter ATP-binding protein [Firmicutes bacterium]|jgi:branched-chain amino acid transport system ATP-binding protein|nr:ABC transporter ATP-binding protein [Bacillota bacterium]
MLKLSNVEVHYGNIRALKDVSLEVHEGEIVCLLGSNGAGKTTTLRCISGLLRPSRGEVIFQGKRISGISPDRIVAMGVAHTPEGRAIFPQFTVYENLLAGAYLRNDRSGIQQDVERMFNKFPRLGERRAQLGGSLSGGEQQMLAIARTMMSRPKLILLDEPSMGLAPVLVNEVFEMIRDLHSEGTTVLLVEQNARKALAVADRGYLLETGRITLADTAQKLLADKRMIEGYLGGSGYRRKAAATKGSDRAS